MSNLSDWADVIQKAGEKSRKDQEAREAKIAAELPGEIEKLPSRTIPELPTMLVYFSGLASCYWPNEGKLWATYAKAIEVEILHRMGWH